MAKATTAARERTLCVFIGGSWCEEIRADQDVGKLGAGAFSNPKGGRVPRVPLLRPVRLAVPRESQQETLWQRWVTWKIPLSLGNRLLLGMAQRFCPGESLVTEEKRGSKSILTPLSCARFASTQYHCSTCLGDTSPSKITDRLTDCYPVRGCARLKATASEYFTPVPPKMSRAEPMVKSILPWPARVTCSKSAKEEAPPA